MVNLDHAKEIIEGIRKERPEIDSVYYVGCGASQAELYPAVYFLNANAKKLRSNLMQANEFVHATPAAVGPKAIVVTCSLGGNTPETVEATKKAVKLGAKVIAITHEADSPLAAAAEYVILHGFEASYSAKCEKMIYALAVANEILHQYEDDPHYAKMLDAMKKIPALVDESVSHVVPEAMEFAKAYKDAPVIYVMSSGATRGVAYTFSNCLMMEMQWINSGNFHDGDFFHGPFEIVDKDVPFLLFMNDGRTRALDSRALDFLHRFNALTTVVDAKDFGLASVADADVIDYFNPVLLTAVVRVYAEQLAALRDHPLTKRRYMWKLEY
ncbi:MAG: SIS domain-containing protein [Clostridiales bacterium]|nr:SIS domain-containing protein [Clostridiales bacterium]